MTKKTGLPKPGSTMSTKQLASTVKNGRILTFHLLSGEPIKGYLCGMDDFHWMVVTPDGRKLLLHKGTIPLIEIGDDAYSSEPKHEELEEIVAPFRAYLHSQERIPA